ncbi:hypothetical protein ON010_g942 [Phytophthora cinnamomi]|nr:hypothetical protein ON010_g942 [Phytophthora cinnamomi]
MDAVVPAAYGSVLDEEALLTIVDDVWGDQGPPGSPPNALILTDQAQDCTLPTDADVPEECTTSSTDQEPEPKKPKKKRRRDRNRPWHEIARLQSESEELERQLEEQLTSSSKTARGALLRHNENATLKQMLQESVEDTRELERNVFRQMTELLQKLPRSLFMTRNLQYDSPRDDMVFRLMAQSVDEQYKDMDRVMDREGLTELTTEVVESYVDRATSVYTGGESGELLKFRARILSPFKSGMLEKAFWKGVEDGFGATIGNIHPAIVSSSSSFAVDGGSP